MNARHLAAQAILRETTEQRHRDTVTDPLAFAFTYLLHHLYIPDPKHACNDSPCLKENHQHYTLSNMHIDWADIARQQLLQQGSPYRASFIAPRDSGKSTWWFLVIPLWAAAHQHSRFCAAFADSATQAEKHLATFKHELDNNQTLRKDFPQLVQAAKRPTTGGNIADNRSLIVTQQGFSFNATGIDASTLGLKINQARPDFIIFDDIEPDESSYSIYQAKKRLTTVQDAILPMNLKAKVFFVGTVTMAGGLTHQLQQASQQQNNNQQSSISQWIKDEKIQIFYYAPIMHSNITQKEQSIWPEKWPIEYLDSIRHTRSFAKNFQNKPKPQDSDYWSEEDFSYGIPGPPTHTIISIDPAITTKKTSDFTGIAVISFKPKYNLEHGGNVHILRPLQEARQQQVNNDPTKTQARFMTREQRQNAAIIVHDAFQVKLTNEFLRQQVLATIQEHQDTNHPIKFIYIEVNQGQDLWYNVLHDMPIPVRVHTTTIKKEVRAARTLNYYQRNLVWHARPIPQLEEQMTSYPNSLHDDMIDAVGQGVTFYMDRLKKRNQPQVASVSYIR